MSKEGHPEEYFEGFTGPLLPEDWTPACIAEQLARMAPSATNEPPVLPMHDIPRDVPAYDASGLPLYAFGDVGPVVDAWSKLHSGALPEAEDLGFLAVRGETPVLYMKDYAISDNYFPEPLREMPEQPFALPPVNYDNDGYPYGPINGGYSR